MRWQLTNNYKEVVLITLVHLWLEMQVILTDSRFNNDPGFGVAPHVSSVSISWKLEHT